jgi:hypothetical protein
MSRKRGAAPRKVIPPREDLVQVAVPARYVEHVAALIAELDRQARPAPPVRDLTANRVPEPGGDWPLPDLVRLAQGRTNSHRTAFAMLDFLARHPDEFFLLSQVGEAIGVPRKALIGGLSGLTKVLKSQFDYGTYGLPMSRVMDRIEDRKEELHYGLTGTQAERWRAARREEG